MSIRMFYSLKKPLCIALLSLTCLAQETPVSEWPDLVQPPYIPEFLCPFGFIAFSQPSQGVFQDDPADTDFLEVISGAANYQDIYFGEAPYYGAPIYRAKIPMVAGRDTFLLGAQPYASLPLPSPQLTNPNVMQLQFKGYSYASRKVAVMCRVSVYQNQKLLHQYMLSKEPRDIYFDGTCQTVSKVLDYKMDVFENKANTPLNFRFTEAGTYLIRTELVYYDPFQLYISELQPTGIAVNVVGTIVTTKPPKVHVIPLVKSGYSSTIQKAYYTSVKSSASKLGTVMQEFMAIPSANVPISVQSGNVIANSFDDFEDLAEFGAQSLRASTPTKLADRLVLVVEEESFTRMLAATYGNQANFEQIRYSEGFALNKKVVVIRGPARTINQSEPYFLPGSLTSVDFVETAVQCLLQTFSDPLWQPSTGKMGDCKVTPYFHTDKRIAFGTDLRDPGNPSIYTAKHDIMGKTGVNRKLRICQCTYRHSLNALSKALIDPPMVVISGTVSQPGLFAPQAELNPLYQVNGFPELSQTGSGRWRIDLKNAFGLTLASYPFTPNFQVDGYYVNRAFFNYTLDAPAGLDRVEIYGPELFFGGYGFRLLDTVSLSANAPGILDVEIVQTGPLTEIAWYTFDFDGDALLASIFVSEDGAFFEPTEVFESQGSSAFLEIPPSMNFVKLVVSDGGRSVQRIIAL